MDLSLKLALRQLAKSPGFAVVSILMLALGIAMVSGYKDGSRRSGSARQAAVVRRHIGL